MASKNTTELIDNLMKGLDTVLTTKTVVGDASKIGDTIIVPLMDVTFGIGAGTGADKKDGAGGCGCGITGKMSPSAVLVIQDGSTRLVNIKNTDNISRALDLVPEIINRFKTKKDISDSDIKEAAFPEAGSKEF